MMRYSSDNFRDSADKLKRDDTFFKQSEVRDDNAFLEWRMQCSPTQWNFKEMGEGYLIASIVALENCLADNEQRNGDALIFPALFNACHGVELYLKAMSFLLEEFAKSHDHEGTFQKRKLDHKLKPLYNDLMLMLQNHYATICKDMAVVGKFIDIIDSKTADPAFARYPMSKKLDPEFYVDTNEHIIIDMRDLKEWVEGLFYILDMSFVNLDAELDARQKAELDAEGE